MRAVARLLARLVATFLLVTFAATLLLQLTPGSPATVMAGDNTSPAVVDAINRQYGFDDPLLVRYGDWLAGLFRGDLGISYLNRQPVLDTILRRFPVTFELALLATLLALAIAVPLAVLCAQHQGSRLDRLVGALGSAGVSVPSFVVAMTLIYLLAYRTHVFPLIGWTPFTEAPLENVRGAVLPVVSIALADTVVLLRVLRADLIQTLQQDFIALARSKGLPRRTIMWRHALRPSSFSLLTLSALTLARLLAGTVLVETIFVLPGLGTLLLESITNKDLVTVQGTVAFIAIAFLAVNFLVDLLYGLLDPRTRVRA
ncbi:ABC transporter permease [Actinomadura rugatobispora]|uniref:ABC transporter permease n=1 Tax=Actinomadura rugatobispora TaxID=1994 RepID=A0ABW0ZWP9_9ACTN|nr:ABC transporter permease [Actinomadura rugatobispora]